MLFRLKKTQRKLIVATSKPEIFARKIIVHFGLAACFDAVCGADLEGKRSSKSDVIRYALESCGIAPETPGMVMVGDRRYDIIGARDNGLDAIAVLYGIRQPGRAARGRSRPFRLQRGGTGKTARRNRLIRFHIQIRQPGRNTASSSQS